MSEFNNQDFAKTSDQNPPVSGSSEGNNGLHEEVIQQWQADRVMEVADTSKNKHLSKKEPDKAIDEAQKAPSGDSKLTKEELRFAQQLQSTFESTKDLSDDEMFLPDREVSRKDLEKVVANQPHIKQLEDHFGKCLKELQETGRLNNNLNLLDQEQYHFTDEVLKAMARGNSTQLAQILDRYGQMQEELLQHYMSTIKEVLKTKGGSLNFSKSLSNPKFSNVIFPSFNGRPVERERILGPSAEGVVVLPAKTEKPIMHDANGKEKPLPRKFRR